MLRRLLHEVDGGAPIKFRAGLRVFGPMVIADRIRE